MLTRQQLYRFWSKVDKSGDCWVWTGARTVSARNPIGYGVININHRMYRAHRVAYIIIHGAIPDDLDVLHTCDNPICVNPAHLWAGTHAENMADKVEKGRQSRQRVPHNQAWHETMRGERNHNAKLTDDEVREIVRRYGLGGTSYGKLAREYGVTQSYIGQLVRGLWRK